VVEARRAPLEQRSNNHDTEFAGELTQRPGGGSGNRFSQRKQFCAFLAAEILRTEKFGETDNLRTLPRGFSNPPERLLEIFVRVDSTVHLHQAHAECLEFLIHSLFFR